MANSIIEFLGSPPAAPVFMLALGVGVVYSKKNSAEDLATRGCRMFVMSYIYNLLVYALPHIILFFTDKDTEHLATAIEEFSNVDILQFASLAFLTFAFIKKLKWGTPQIIVYTVMVSLAGEFAVNNISIPEGGAAYVLGLFWGSCEASFFPYASWIIFPMAGYIFGMKLSECKDKQAFYLGILKCFAPIYVVMMINAADAGIDFGQLTGEYQTSYYHLGLYGGVCLTAFALAWFAICYFVSKIIPEGIMDYLKNLSRNITKIYVLQYILIIYSYEFIVGEESNLGLTLTLIASFIIFTITKYIHI